MRTCRPSSSRARCRDSTSTRMKDPLYSLGAASARRRSAQSALLYVLTRFLVALAPILSFTTEEAWQSLPEALRGDTESVFDLSLGAPGANADDRSADLALWETLRELRGRVAASESPRDFEARVLLAVPAGLYDRLAPLGDNLREALVVSQLDLEEVLRRGRRRRNPPLRKARNASAAGSFANSGPIRRIRRFAPTARPSSTP